MTNNRFLEMVYGKVDFNTFMEMFDEIRAEEFEEKIFEAESMDLAEELRQYAKKTGVTASDIASDLGINRSSVTRWLNGNSLPRREGTIKKVREYLLSKGLGN